MYSSEMTDPPVVQEVEEPKMSASRRLAQAAWDVLKGDDDPAFEAVPVDTQRRLEAFAREVRNATIEHLAGAIKRYYEKTNSTAVDSLLSLKE